MTATAIDRTIEDRLSALESDVAFIAGELREQRARREMWDELRSDLAPIATDAMSLASRELETVTELPSSDDLLRLARRLARNTNNIEAMLSRLESVLELVDDASPILGEAVAKATSSLEDFEKRGYFGFARSSLGVVDRVVTSFTEDDVNQLGDNIVLILQTVKEMTQPEVMELLQRTAHVLEEDVPSPSTFALLRQMRDPEVKRGLARMLRVMRSLADTSSPETIEQQTSPGGTS